MLASELAAELGVDPSVITKRLNLYSAELGTERSRTLSDQTISHMRDVQRLLVNRQAQTAKIAIQMALGRYVDPLPSASVQMIADRISQLQTTQDATQVLIAQLLQALHREPRPLQFQMEEQNMADFLAILDLPDQQQ